MSFITHYYGNGRIVRETPDGRHWREASPAELDVLDPDAPVILATGDPVSARDYQELVLPGGYPFLPGMAALLPVYIEEERT